MNIRKDKTKLIILIGIMGGISFILQLMEIHIFGFLALDFSDIPAIIMSTIYGPLAGVVTEVIKNLIKMLVTKTAFVGEIANIIVGCAFVIPIGILFKKKPRVNLSNVVLIFLVATISMTVTGAIANYFVLIPFFSSFVKGGVAGIIKMIQPFIPIIHNKLDLILYYITPFNILKGLLLSIISIILMKFSNKYK